MTELYTYRDKPSRGKNTTGFTGKNCSFLQYSGLWHLVMNEGNKKHRYSDFSWRISNNIFGTVNLLKYKTSHVFDIEGKTYVNQNQTG